MTAEGWRTWPMETGGIILGKPTGTGAEITTVIGPGPDATHERYTFQPNSDWQATRVADAWEEDPTTEYLGDWHTHPVGTTRFSALDRATALSIAEYPAARQPEPFMLVFALGADLRTQVAAAQLVDGSLRPVNIEVTSV